MVCPTCGTTNPPLAIYCYNCGSTLTNATKTDFPNFGQPAPPVSPSAYGNIPPAPYSGTPAVPFSAPNNDPAPLPDWIFNDSAKPSYPQTPPAQPTNLPNFGQTPPAQPTGYVPPNFGQTPPVPPTSYNAPSGYGQPASPLNYGQTPPAPSTGYVPPNFGAPSGYNNVPPTYGQPSGYNNMPPNYGQPGGYNAPPNYGQPGGFGYNTPPNYNPFNYGQQAGYGYGPTPFGYQPAGYQPGFAYPGFRPGPPVEPGAPILQFHPLAEGAIGLNMQIQSQPQQFYSYVNHADKLVFVRRANFSSRFGAAILDLLLLGVLLFCILIFVAVSLTPSGSGGRIQNASNLTNTATGWVLLFVYSVFFGYFFLTGISKGQSVGKRATRIRVIRLDGQPPDVITGLLRYLAGYMLSSNLIVIALVSLIFTLINLPNVATAVVVLSFGWGFWWAARDELKQGWHDKLARTLVVDVREYVEGVDFVRSAPLG